MTSPQGVHDIEYIPFISMKGDQEDVHMIKANVYITIKQNVLDPQGNAVLGALQSTGFEGVSKVRVGKLIELQLQTTDRAEAEQQVRKMCEQLLANTVVEDYEFELEGI